MKYFLFFSVFFLPPFLAQSQTKFQRTYGNQFKDLAGASPTSDKGYIISVNTDTAAPPGMHSKCVLIKTDSMGNAMWKKEYTRTGYSSNGTDAIQTMDGGYLFVITFFFNNNPVEADIVKTDANGDTLWMKKMTQFGAEIILQTSDSGYVFIGAIWLTKTDKMGNVLWKKAYYGGWGTGMGGRQTTDKGFILFNSTYTYSSGPPSDDDFYLVKTDSLGTVQWTRTFGGSNGFEEAVAQCIHQTTDGGYIMAGTTDGFGMGGLDMLVVKTDSDGNLQWAKTYGGPGWDYPSSIQDLSGAAGYILIGNSQGTDIPQNGVRGIMVRLDISGNLIWSNMYGSVFTNPYASDYIWEVDVAPGGGFIFSGFTESIGNASYSYPDFWLVRTDANGVSGCNEKPESIYITVPPLIVGSGGTDSTLAFIQTTNAVMNVGIGQLSDSILCQTIPIGVNEITNKEEINIYPNPTGGVFNLKMGQFENLKMKSIEIYNVYGEKIFYNNHFQINSSSNLQIDLSSQPDGIYFVRINTSEGIISKKVVVMR